MIFVDDYGDLSKYTANFEDYTRLIGQRITVYTAGGVKFSGILYADSGSQIMLASPGKSSPGSEQRSIIIFKRHITALELPLERAGSN